MARVVAGKRFRSWTREGNRNGEGSSCWVVGCGRGGSERSCGFEGRWRASAVESGNFLR